MRTRKTITQTVLIGIIVSQAIIIILLMANWGTQAEIAGWVSSVLIPLLAMAYEVVQHHSLRFFLMTQRLKNWFGGRSVTWNFAVNLNGNFDTTDLDRIVKHLTSLPKYTSSIRVNRPYESGRFLVIRGGLNVELSLQESSPALLSYVSKTYIHMAIHNLRVNLNDAINIIDKEIMPLVSEVEKGLKTTEKTYSMIVEFEKTKNPFFGLYLERFDPENIADFQVVIVINDYGEKDTVTILDSKIQILARSAHAISSLGKEFLTFHPNLRLRLRNG